MPQDHFSFGLNFRLTVEPAFVSMFAGMLPDGLRERPFWLLHFPVRPPEPVAKPASCFFYIFLYQFILYWNNSFWLDCRHHPVFSTDQGRTSVREGLLRPRPPHA